MRSHFHTFWSLLLSAWFLICGPCNAIALAKDPVPSGFVPPSPIDPLFPPDTVLGDTVLGEEPVDFQTAELEELKRRLKSLEDACDTAPTPSKKSSYPNARITGFTQLDGVFYDQSDINKETLGNAQNGFGFRRARLAVYGDVAENTRYQVEMDFATAGRPSF
ncbi:MAG TPA: hypothetical protein VNQ76_00935, partial [Planctomicrobium sp.]|nr:hypothetical protein [Planctomicrobium sp.]